MRIDVEISRPFRCWLLSDVVRPDLARAAHDTLPPASWPGWVRYANDCEQKRTTRDVARLGPAIADLYAALNSPAWIAQLERLTGVAGLSVDPLLHGAGIHVSDFGDYLSPHLDYARHPVLSLERRLSLVLFLTPTWREEWGGAFELWDDAAQQVSRRILPAFNRGILFENGDLAYHGTQRVAAEAPPRVTAACYYLALPRPGCVRRRALFVPHRQALPAHPS